MTAVRITQSLFKKDFPFDKDTIEKYYEKYVELTENKIG